MAKNSYNGTILPALPKNAYPYSAIHFNILSDTEYNAELVCSTCALTISDGFISSSLIAAEDGTLTVYTANQAATEWKQKTDGEKNFTAGESVYSFALGDLKWSNYDILNTDGTVYLAASEPVPVLEIQIPEGVDRYSYVVGFNLALAGFSFPYSKPRKPAAYLYNGIRLPALPEWDRGVYPFAYMAGMWSIQTDGSYSYIWAQLIVSSVPLYYGPKLGNYERLYAKETASIMKYSASNEDDNGSNVSGWDSGDSGEIEAGSYSLFSYTPGYFWCNTDLYYYEDATVYLAASDPVPVYE